MNMEERLERLESKLTHANRLNRWLLAGTVLAVVVLAAGVWIAFAEHGTAAETVEQTIGELADLGVARRRMIRASRFVLMDKKGKERATLAMYQGDPRLTFMDPSGITRAWLAVRHGGPSLVFMDPEGEVRTFLAMREGQPSLFFKGENGLGGIWLQVKDDGPVLDFWGGKGKDKRRASFQLREGEPVLDIQDAMRNSLWSAP